MKIGVAAWFYPNVGGIETLARQLAAGFVARGHGVTVVTPIAGGGAHDARLPFTVLRQPAPVTLLRELRRLDVLLQLGLTLRVMWAAVATGTPVVVSHQAWFVRRAGRLLWREWLKRRYTPHCVNIVASAALTGEPLAASVLIPNCYDDAIFRPLGSEPRTGDLIFVGRLVSDKGVDLLLRAMERLRRRTNLQPSLDIVGDGPERESLQTMIRGLALEGRVRFHGIRPPNEIARLLNRSRVLVVPSRWKEPFGIVALEGIACGCRIVASDGGGLPDVVGGFGTLFARADIDSLCDALQTELQGPGIAENSAAARARHLDDFREAKMIDRYLQVLGRHARAAKGQQA